MWDWKEIIYPPGRKVQQLLKSTRLVKARVLFVLESRTDSGRLSNTVGGDDARCRWKGEENEEEDGGKRRRRRHVTKGGGVFGSLNEQATVSSSVLLHLVPSLTR